MAEIRPLRRCCPGVWCSRDGRWEFKRHFSDPHPQRWYAYIDDGAWPVNDGQGHVTLREAADFATRHMREHPELEREVVN